MAMFVSTCICGITRILFMRNDNAFDAIYIYFFLCHAVIGLVRATLGTPDVLFFYISIHSPRLPTFNLDD